MRSSAKDCCPPFEAMVIPVLQGVRILSSSDERPTLKKLARGWRKRSLVTAKTLAKVGLGAAKQTLGSGAQEKDDQAALERAEAMLAELDGLKGFAMKIGQMVSYLDTSLPPQAQKVLAKLQSQGRPMEPEQIRQVVIEELGAAPDQLFDEFEPTPFAAASIGQVHRARKGDKHLAVKIQYPGIRELLSSDLKSIKRLSRLAGLLSPVDGPAIAEEMRARMMEECDYRQEATHQGRFRDLFSGHSEILIPSIVQEFSAERVLASEYMDGCEGFYPFIEGANEERRRRAAELLFMFSFQSIFGHRIYNADPHPGNYLFRRDGVVFFGLWLREVF